MNVGFYITRMSYVAQFGPLIDYFREKGAKISLLCDHRKKPKDCSYKAYQYPHPENIRDELNTDDIQIFYTTEEFVNIILKNSVQAVFFLAINTIARQAKALTVENKVDVIFAHLQTSGDILFVNNTISDLPYCDVIYLFSENLKIWWKEWLSQFKITSEAEQNYIFEQIETKTVITGQPEMDQVVSFDRCTICKKYGIPPDRPVILLLPFPWRIPFNIGSHISYKYQNKVLKILKLLMCGGWKYIPDMSKFADDLQVTEAISQFAKQNNACFLVKARLKNKVPSYLKKIADSVIYDLSYYPYTILELMFIADLSIGFFSGAIRESIICETPSICLGPKIEGSWPPLSEISFLSDFSLKSESFYNFEGVVYFESVEDFSVSFQNKTFDDYPLNEKNRDSFIKKFLGFSDLRSSERIYNDISQRIASWENDG